MHAHEARVGSTFHMSSTEVPGPATAAPGVVDVDRSLEAVVIPVSDVEP
jgi:hypothetical protein